MRNNSVNPVRNSSRCDSKPSRALNPALRGGTPYGSEPGIILKSNPAQFYNRNDDDGAFVRVSVFGKEEHLNYNGIRAGSWSLDKF